MVKSMIMRKAQERGDLTINVVMPMFHGLWNMWVTPSLPKDYGLVSEFSIPFN